MKELYQVEIAASNAIETAIGTITAAPYNSTKDVGRLMPYVMTRNLAIRMLIQAALRKRMQGAIQGVRSIVTGQFA